MSSGDTVDREMVLGLVSGVMSAIVDVRVTPVRWVLLVLGAAGVVAGAAVELVGIAHTLPVVVPLFVLGALLLVIGCVVWLVERLVRALLRRFIAPPRAVPTSVEDAVEAAGIPTGPIGIWRYARKARANPDGVRAELLASLERVGSLPTLIDEVAPARDRMGERP